MRGTGPSPKCSEDLLLECYLRALELLRRNLTPEGILASTPDPKAAGRNYTSIFGRDAAICALGMAVSGDGELFRGACAGLRTLARRQAPNGQIPKFVRPRSGEADFWYTGCIDATLWWVLALHWLDRWSPEEALGEELRENVEGALRWLLCQEHQEFGLLQQNEASDWADIMPRSGFVLYTNALWYQVKKAFDLPRHHTLDYANQLLFPFGNVVPGHRRARLLAHYIRNRMPRRELYLSFVNFSFWGTEIDVFGNILAALTGLADSSRAVQIAEALKARGTNAPWPMRAADPPLEKDDPLWRRYMERHRQNLPYQYHNGGCWPFIGGFWVLLLKRLGREEEAWRELERMAEACRAGGWQFNEWFHGRTGEAMGMAGQSWNAAMFVLAWHLLQDRRRLFG